MYHTDAHVSVGYTIQRCDGGFTGPGPTAPFTHTHTELLDYCAGGIPLIVIDEITAECSKLEKLDAVQSCIEGKIQRYLDEQ